MCGIIACIEESAKDNLINGLKKMEYRGYDSSGIAYFFKNKIKTYKTISKINELEKIEDLFGVGIGHTRWATHGKVTEQNAHPIASFDQKIFIVHNGIIENTQYLKETFLKEIEFNSQTDTEVLVNLIAFFYQHYSIIDSIKKTLRLIEGSYAFLLIVKDNPESVYCATHNMPLLLGVSSFSVCIASDILAFPDSIEKYYRLPDGFLGEINIGSIKDKYPFEKFNYKSKKLEETGRHYMLNEILEEKDVIEKIHNNFLKNESVKALLKRIKKVKSIAFIGSGSSYNASMVAKYFLDKNYDIHTSCYMASEFIYNQYPKADLYFIISQSGETADTIKAMNKIDKYSYIVSLTNVTTSTIATKANCNFDMLCGSEVAVASTKAFMASIFFFYMLFNNKPEYKKIVSSIERILTNSNQIKEISEKFKDENKIIFLGRGLDGIINNENSLKIKEIAYISIENYFGGELKHGPLALIDKDSVVLILNTNLKTNNIMRTNIEEVMARGGQCYTISTILNNKENDLYSFNLINDESIFESTMFFQMFAYFLAILKGYNPDRPRNLAKSVTVE